MSEQSFPPVGDPDRFSAIVARGTSMRRRRRAATGLGAGGGLAAIAAVVVLAVGGTGGAGGAETPVVADAPDGDTPTTITSSVPATTEASGGLTVVVGVEDADDGGQRYFLTVEDPQQPISELSQQCVFVHAYEDLDDEPIGEGFNCRSGSGTEPAVVTLIPTETQIGCPAFEHADLPEPTGVAAVSTRFDLDVSALSPVGDDGAEPSELLLEVTASSGQGDGCSAEPAEHERRTTLDAPVSIVVD